MYSKQEEYTTAYNKFLDSQREIQATDDNPDPKYTLIKFATELEILKNSKISEAEALNSKNYSPSGSTALYDAIGCTVSAYKNEKFNNLVILTDGEENASRIYHQKQIKKLIEKIQGDDFGWTVDYLAANQDAFASGGSIGLSRASIQPYSVNQESIQSNFMMLGQKIQQKRVQQNLALKNYHQQAQNLN